MQGFPQGLPRVDRPVLEHVREAHDVSVPRSVAQLRRQRFLRLESLSWRQQRQEALPILCAAQNRVVR